jgi:hypothetical protein
MVSFLFLLFVASVEVPGSERILKGGVTVDRRCVGLQYTPI